MFNRFKKYFVNVSWMMSEKVISLLLGFTVSIFLARNIGPENFGVYSYALSVTTLFAVISHLGLNGIVIRDLSKTCADSGEIIACTLFIKGVGVIVSLLLFSFYIVSYESYGSPEFWALLALSGVVLTTPVDVFDYWFQSQVRYKYVMFSRVIAILIGSALKVILVILGLGVTWVALSHSLALLLFSFVIFIFYIRSTYRKKYRYRIDLKKVKDYLAEGLLVYLGTIFAMIYMKVDQIMIRWLSGSEDVGIYAVAAQLSEAWYFIPVTIIATVFPRLIELRESDLNGFNQAFQKLLDFLFIFALVISVFITLFSHSIIELLYGQEYMKSAIVLSIHVWAGIFIFMRAAFSRWIIIEKMYVFSILTQGVGSLVNVIMNYYLIPIYGVNGAAYSTLISYLSASYLSLALYKKTRPIFWMMSKSLLSPFSYLYHYFKTHLVTH